MILYTRAHGDAGQRPAMKNETLDKILACPSLPSLPAVALRVIEQCSDPDIKIAELAKTIQNDQAMSAKVLRTVNSSFYGLREKCGNINKALVMLGLSPVKALVLGFSLVSSVEPKNDTEFDYQDYWRRGLFTAVGAKFIVEASGKKYGDDAFVAGLLQDIGVMAMYRALGAEYLEVFKLASDHRDLGRHEMNAFETQHSDIGAMLAQRWKMPDSLVIPVKYHERPSAAPLNHLEITQAVGLGNLLHDAVTSQAPAESLRRLYAKAECWLAMKPDAVDACIDRVRQATAELAGLFKVEIGDTSCADSISAKADAALASISAPASSPTTAGVELLLVDPSDIDPATSIMGRKGFDWSIRRAHKVAREDGDHASLVSIMCPLAAQTSPDGLAARAVLISQLRKAFTPIGGAVSLLAPGMFAAVAVGVAPAEVAAIIDLVRESTAKANPRARILTGAVHFGADAVASYGDPAAIIKAANQALQASAKAA